MAAKKTKKAAPKAKTKAAKKPAPKAAKAAKKAAPKAAKKPAPKAAKAAKKAPKHRIVHWEIQSQMPERLHDFYSSVFGWAIDANNPMKYGMVSSGDALNAINGGIGGSEAPGSRVVVYTGVPDIEEALAAIEAHGGRTTMPRTDLGMVIIAQYIDPEGNAMGLIEG